MNTGRKVLVWLGCALAVVVLSPAAAWSGTVQAAGRIEAVTVYRGQALVTRAVEFQAPAGPVELIVESLPAQVVGDSLHVSTEGGVQVRAVQYRARAVEQEPRPELRQLQGQIEETEKLLRQLQAGLSLLKQKEAYLANLEQFTAGKVKDEMARGTLNADTVKGVSEFLFQQRGVLAKEALESGEAHRDTQAKLGLLQRQYAEMAARFSRTAREAVLFLDLPGAGKAVVRLHYIVQGASWSPMYNLRSRGEGPEVDLEYNALIQQMSGEGWDGVRLTLSTASPTMLAEAPVLSPLWVTLAAAPPAAARQSAEALFGGQKAYLGNLSKALQSRRPADASNSQLRMDWDLNVWANRLQFTDLVAGKDALLAGRAIAGDDQVLSVNYTLPRELSVPSRSDQQMIQIAMLKLRGEFYYQAAPVLSPYVYQQADVVNTSKVALLSGPVSAYLDGQFMGTGQLPLVAKGQRFTVGFGVDSQLRAGRELADKTDRVQGGNRELSFQYRLLLDNYKDKPVKVRLLDRLPDPRGMDIRVTLIKGAEALSTEPVYLRTLRKSGILRWETDVPAGSSGAKAKAVEYTYKLEFDRNMHLAEPSPAQVEKDMLEFEERLRASQAAQ
ncbi:MAG TPA: mucoidy inhibitor MuiA family protein [Phycisphaerae bacterium]|nr:mucoidy inhibitor MuiA family protein [Phycisphaerae bacterium]